MPVRSGYRRRGGAANHLSEAPCCWKKRPFGKCSLTPDRTRRYQFAGALRLSYDWSLGHRNIGNG